MDQDTYWQRRTRRPVGRRLLLTSTAAGCGLSLFGCSSKAKSGQTSGAEGAQPGGQSSETPQPGGTLNTSILYNPTLDPQKVSAAPQVAVAGVYSRVFRFKTSTDPKTITNHDLENDLGLSAETADGITWTIKLRPDAKFTNIPPVNGHAVEAEDVKSSFVRALDPATGNPNRGSLGMVDPAQIQTPDRSTVIFRLKFPYTPFNKTLASPAYSLILPREALAGSYDPSKVVIGSGPFVLDSVTPDVAYVYKKNPDWFDKPRPYVDTLRVAVVPDAQQRLAQFSAGNIDELTVMVDDLDAARQRNPKATLTTYASGTPWPTFWQLGDPTSPFQDIRVRRAFSMAIDRDTVAKVIFKGQIVQPVFLPEYLGKWALNVSDLDAETQQYYRYNPLEAKKLLEAAGVTDLQLKFGQVVNGPGSFGQPIYMRHSETLSNMLNAVGIKTNLVQIDYNKEYIAGGKGSSEGFYPKDMIVFGGMSVYTEADEYLFGYWDSKSTNSHEHLNDPQMDAMIDKQRTILDENQRLTAVREIVKYVASQMLMLSSVGGFGYSMIQPRVRNYNFSDSLGSHTEMYSKIWLKQ